MMRWMCGVSLKGLRMMSEGLQRQLGIECVLDVIRCDMLRWYGYVERVGRHKPTYQSA